MKTNRVNFNDIKTMVKNSMLKALSGQDLSFKDCSLGYLSKKLDKEIYALVGDVVLKTLSHYKDVITDEHAVTVDLFYREFDETKRKTCVSPGLHTDGKDNYHSFYQIGGPRTMFEKNGELVEIPEEKVFFYNSRDRHKGRICDPGEKRLSVRVCLSKYIKPRNHSGLRY